MALPDVNIVVVNGDIDGAQPVADRVIGLLLSGTAVADKIALNEPHLLTSVDDLVTLGITADNNPLAYQEIVEFYTLAARGTNLYIMLFSNATTLKDMMDKTSATGTVKLLEYAKKGTPIKFLGINIVRANGYTPTMSADGLDQDVLDAATNAKALVADYFTTHYPLRVILPCMGFAIAAADTVHNFRQDTNNVCSFLLSANDSTGRIGIGLFMGREASIPVQRNPGRVRDGAMITTEPYWPDGSLWSTLSGKLGALNDKGYIFFRNWPRKNGFYYNDDPTSAPTTDDQNSLSRAFVIDKAHEIAYDTYVNEILDDIKLNTQNGTMSPSVITGYQAEIESAINAQMADNISACKCYIDPTQNLSSENTPLKIRFRILPMRQNKWIDVEIGFASSLS